MPETIFKHIDEDLESLKRDVAVIKHILSEEGKLTDFAKKTLAKARVSPKSDYISHDEVKSRMLKKWHGQ